MNTDIDQEWHCVLSERDGLRSDLETITDVLLQYHDDHHHGTAQWCDAPPCHLLFRPHIRREPGRLAA